jgi:prepilin-type N-terminal cleavage/methylation domain-containing protein
MLRSSSLRGFTLIEMLTVMLIIAILAGIVLSINGLVQNKAARSRAEGEINALKLACENYKADNGTAPRSSETDLLDARVNGNPNSTAYQQASLFLYKALSGDLNANGKLDPEDTKSYASDLFKPSILNFNKDGDGKILQVNYIKDPFDNSYGYSTIGAKDEEDFVEAVRKSATPTKVSRPTEVHGFNPTFDLWSTGGTTTTTSGQSKWVKNW